MTSFFVISLNNCARIGFISLFFSDSIDNFSSVVAIVQLSSRIRVVRFSAGFSTGGPRLSRGGSSVLTGWVLGFNGVGPCTKI